MKKHAIILAKMMLFLSIVISGFAFNPILLHASTDDVDTYALITPPDAGGSETIISTGTYNWAVNNNANVKNYNCYAYAIGQTGADYAPGD